MAHHQSTLAFGILVIASSQAIASDNQRLPGNAPSGTAQTRYCMYVEPVTGSRIEQVRCWTRAEWAEQGVDLDADWAREGIRTLG
jgi:hypothetical protein